MPLSDRFVLFQKVAIDSNTEYDYIKSSLNDMELSTIEKMRLDAVYAFRPDLISFKYYGSFDFGWLIAFHNDIVDPTSEFTVGKMIDIPSIEDYYRFVNRNKKKGVIDG